MQFWKFAELSTIIWLATFEKLLLVLGKLLRSLCYDIVILQRMKKVYNFSTFSHFINQSPFTYLTLQHRPAKYLLWIICLFDLANKGNSRFVNIFIDTQLVDKYFTGANSMFWKLHYFHAGTRKLVISDLVILVVRHRCPYLFKVFT